MGNVYIQKNLWRLTILTVKNNVNKGYMLAIRKKKFTKIHRSVIQIQSRNQVILASVKQDWSC